MSTFVRVKRHRSELSSDTLLLRFKKQRINEKDDNETQVLTYVGTLDAKHAESQEEITKLSSTIPHTDRQYTLFNFREKARANQVQNRKQRVLRIIDSFRHENNEQPCRIIHAEILPENETQYPDIDNEYVFDVFSTRNNCESNVIEMTLFDSFYDYGSDTDSDSNIESYYGNDYPDTDTEDILDRIKQIDFNHDSPSDFYCDNYCYDTTPSVGNHDIKYEESSSDSSDDI